MLRKNKEYPSPLLRARSKTSSLLKREWSNIQVTDVVVGRSHTREPLSEKTHILQFHTPSSGQGTQRSNIASAWGRGARCLVRQGLHVRWDRHQLPSGAGSPRESEARVAFWGGVSTWGRGARCLVGGGCFVASGDTLCFAPEHQKAGEILASQSPVGSNWSLITLKSK